MIENIHIAQFLCWLCFAPCISLAVFGFYFVSREGFALYRLRTTINAACAGLRLSWLAEPLVECPLCMASLWSLALGLPFGVFVLHLPLLVVLCILPFLALVVAGLNGLVLEWKDSLMGMVPSPANAKKQDADINEALRILSWKGLHFGFERNSTGGIEARAYLSQKDGTISTQMIWVGLNSKLHLHLLNELNTPILTTDATENEAA